jgi:hypothetical protein
MVGYRSASLHLITLSYHSTFRDPLESIASVYGLIANHFRRESLDESAITHCLNDGCL